MRIVLTGSESFIGREMRRKLASRDVEVTGVDAVAGAAGDTVVEDIRSGEIEKAIPWGADAVVHLAAVSRDEDCRRDPVAAFDVNVTGTLNLIRAARAREVRQFVFASSEWVYGEVGNDAIQTEESPVDVARIRSEYALTKVVGERVLGMAYRQGFCPVTILRFGIVYGPRPGNWSAVESLFNAVRTSDRVEVKGSLATARRFVHVADIAEGLVRVLGRSGNETFNLSGDMLITLADIIKSSADVLGRAPEIVEGDASAVSIRNPDNAKARSALGWRPRIGLVEGLQTLMGEQ